MLYRNFLRKKEESDDYTDDDFPKLVLTKVAGYNKYQVKGTEQILYYEPGEGYYTDEGLTQKADMSSFSSEVREGISNADGKMYYSRDDDRDGIITIKTAKEILDRFFEAEPHHKEVNDFKIKSALRAIDDKVPLPSIVLEFVKGKMTLIDGRHRILASIQKGFEYIPYKSKSI